MNDAVVLSFTMYKRSSNRTGEAAIPNSSVVLNAPSSAVHSGSPSMVKAVTRPMLPKYT